MTAESNTDRTLPASYDPSQVEDRWYATWESRGLFHTEPDPSTSPFTIVIPPPNITGMLTMGHVLNNTLQDVFLRWERMKGRPTCWIPGTDHAGIATQTVVEKMLKKTEGKSRHDLGRDAFLTRVWEWRDQYGSIIVQQLRKLGVSCDWDRQVFTMDPDLSTAVREVFIRLYRKGLIYRGKRIINWDPVAHTALSDEEVNYKEQNGKLYYFRYPVLVDGRPSETDWLVVATTRPETMLGDTAVAVHPEDERYRALIGKQVLLPLMDRPIPVIADTYVDMSFGTGVVKITPAHDPNDFEVGLRHDLPRINVMNVDASINEEGGVYQGLDRAEARKRIVADMEVRGLVEKIDDYVHSVGYSERTDVPIEPWLSDQWFVNMKPLAEPALDVVRRGLVRFHPERWVKTFEHWMTNVRDWTISRQLWWGHRIPMYYCDACGWQDALHALPEACPSCGHTAIRQDEDVLDTWFSSWLWPFSVHGWPKDTPALRSFYPTALLVTAPDIIFFWVARMIMAGLEFMKDIPLPDGSPRTRDEDLVPFHDVYFTSIIRDEQGRKMSKSLGNSPDPLDVIREYGADALRFTVLYLAPLGQDVLFSSNKCELGRNFANKIWNAARFVLTNRDRIEAEQGGPLTPEDRTGELGLEDRWIQSRLQETMRDMADTMARFRINEATKLLYEFVWHDFCDWYIELIKYRLYSDDPRQQRQALAQVLSILDTMLALLHPFMPFLTEELWHRIDEHRAADSLMRHTLPPADPTAIDPAAITSMTFLQNLVEEVRTMRGELNVPPSRPCRLVIRCTDEAAIPMIQDNRHFLARLARIEAVEVGIGLPRPKLSASAVVGGHDVYLPLEGLIDLDAERARLGKEIDRIAGMLKGITAKLANEGFTSRAPQDVVENEKQKHAHFTATLARLQANLDALREDA